jgi:TonB family protein
MNLAEYTQSTEANDYYNKILGVSVSTGGGFIGSLATVPGGGAPRLGGGSRPAPWPAPSRASHGGGGGRDGDGAKGSANATDRPYGRPSVAAQADVDFGPYMADVQRRLKRSWFPPKGYESKRVVVVFRIHRDGYMSNLRLDHSSGVAIADQAALEAVRNAAPLHPLPAGAADDVDIQFTFDFNAFNGGGVGKFTRF